MLSRLSLRAVEARGDPAIEDLVDERGLAGAGDPRDECERPERELHIDFLEIVL